MPTEPAHLISAAMKISRRSFWNGDCLEWGGCRVGNMGYGQLTVSKKGRAAHRIAYEISYGEIPNGMLVCHKCDNPPCINPDHLFLGTKQDNNRDKMNKGRHRTGDQKGENNPGSKLTKEGVLEIKERLARNERQSDIAAELGVSRTCVSAISTGRNWKHISGD